MNYFFHKKSKKLIELIKEENGVFTVKEYGKNDEKQMKSALFNKLFEKADEVEAKAVIQQAVDAENKKIAERQEKAAAKRANTERKPRAKKEPNLPDHETERYKELVEKHLIKNTYELLETGHEVHVMVIGLEGKNADTSLMYTSYVKMRHDGIARTYVNFNGETLPEYTNIGITVTAADFCDDLGMLEDDLMFLMMITRRKTIFDNKSRYTVEDIKKARADYADLRKERAIEEQTKRRDTEVAKKAALAEKHKERKIRQEAEAKAKAEAAEQREVEIEKRKADAATKFVPDSEPSKAEA